MSKTSNKITISIDNDRDYKELPVVPIVIYKELCKNFDIDSILTTSKLKNNDEKIGYIRGVRDVLNRVYVLTMQNDDDGEKE